MARNAAKQLLDELMGRERDLGPNQKRATANWSDPSVCKHYLVNFCPNSLFTNTKADIGPCNLVHDDYLKREYQSKASTKEKRAFEDEFIRFCQHQLNEVERKIKRARQRLEMSQLEKGSQVGGSILTEESQERLNTINEKIEKLLEEIEQLGCEGKVEEAQAAMKSLDQLKEEKAVIKRENQSGHWIQQKAEIGVNQEKQMEVCDVCGAFLIVNDVQQRVDDHLMGKQHVGYGRLKMALDELIEKRKNENSINNHQHKSDDHYRGRGSNGRSNDHHNYHEHRDRVRERKDSRDKNHPRERERHRENDRRRSDRGEDHDREYRRHRTADKQPHRHRSRERSRSREHRHGASNGTNHK